MVISRKYLVALLPAAVILLLDQFSKIMVADIWSLPEGYRNEIITNAFTFVHWRNKGAAWGIFDGHTFLLGVVSAVVLVLMLYFFRSLTEGHRMQEFGFGLVLGGVVGNLLDRFIRGSVVDFLWFHHNSFSWPAFNIADSGITVGVTLYVLSVLWHSWRTTRKAGPSATAQ
jgi:signal peptidase II